MNGDNEDQYNDVETTLAAGATFGDPKVVDGGVAFTVIPKGYVLRSLEEFGDKPARKRASVTLRDAKSFIAYYKLHQLGSTIYATIDPPRFVAMLDDHRRDEPGWREHTATYACPLSVEWKRWVEKNGKAMNQAQFAQFTEDNLPDIVDPAGADMLMIALSLEAKKKVNFSSGIRLANGQHELTYEEDIQGSAAKGKLKIPEAFTIGIAVFEGGERYKMEARLRYRIGDNAQLAMWYDLLRPHKVLEDAAYQVWKEIAEGTGTEIFHGSPF